MAAKRGSKRVVAKTMRQVVAAKAAKNFARKARVVVPPLTYAEPGEASAEEAPAPNAGRRPKKSAGKADRPANFAKRTPAARKAAKRAGAKGGKKAAKKAGSKGAKKVPKKASVAAPRSKPSKKAPRTKSATKKAARGAKPAAATRAKSTKRAAPKRPAPVVPAVQPAEDSGTPEVCCDRLRGGAGAACRLSHPDVARIRVCLRSPRPGDVRKPRVSTRSPSVRRL